MHQYYDQYSELKGRLHLLPALQALLETRSVTQAATRLGISQPAMSRQLERLRAEFHDALLVRAGSRMQLTPRAESLLTPLKEVLDSSAALFAATPFDPVTAQRTFQGIIPDVLAAPLLPRLLEQLEAEAPGCRLNLLPWSRGSENASELDFVITSEFQHFPTLKMKRLGEDRDVLASAFRPKPRSNLLALDHVAIVAAGLSEDPVDHWLREMGRSRCIRAVVPHYLLALHLVSSRRYCAILPSRMVGTLGPSLGISGYELPISQDPDHHWLLYPPRLESEPGSLWLRGLIERVCQQA